MRLDVVEIHVRPRFSRNTVVARKLPMRTGIRLAGPVDRDDTEPCLPQSLTERIAPPLVIRRWLGYRDQT